MSTASRNWLKRKRFFERYDLESTAQALQEWYREYVNDEEIDTGPDSVREFLEASGDLNRLHLDEEFPGVSDEEFKEFLEEVVEEVEEEGDEWAESRRARDGEEYRGAFLPGMLYFTVAALEEEEEIQGAEGIWYDVAWIGDEISIDEPEGGEGMRAGSIAPEEEGGKSERAKLYFQTSGEEEYNPEKAAIGNKVVARRARHGDMLVGLEIEFDDTELEELDWKTLELESRPEYTREKVEEKEKGDMYEYSTAVVVDGKVIGEATETFLEIDGYEEIEEEYLEDSWNFNPFDPRDHNPVAYTAVMLKTLNS